MSANATIGSYLAHWKIGSGAPGAPTLDLKTVVSAPTHLLQGAGDIAQAVNPPVNVHTLVTGNFSQMGTAVVISLTGIPNLGAGTQNFQGHINLANGWNQDGVDNVKVTPLHTEQTMTAGSTGSTGTGGSRRT